MQWRYSKPAMYSGTKIVSVYARGMQERPHYYIVQYKSDNGTWRIYRPWTLAERLLKEPHPFEDRIPNGDAAVMLETGLTLRQAKDLLNKHGIVKGDGFTESGELDVGEFESNPGMTLRDAQAKVRAMGMVLRKTQDGELRVNFLRGEEATAYYTTDLHDAVSTAQVMSRQAGMSTDELYEKYGRTLGGKELSNPPERFDTVVVRDVLKELHKLEMRANRNEEAMVYRFLASTLTDTVSRQTREYLGNAGSGRDFVFHGTFKSKRAAQKREKEVPGSFIRPLDRDGQTYYMVLSPYAANDGVHIDINSHNANGRGSYATNPPLLIATNPPTVIGRGVHKIYYVHATEGPRVHEFEADDITMEGLADGSLHIFHPSLRLWGEE